MQPIVTLFEERLANHYTRNRAYFDPLDELVLNDGILFDPRSGSHGRVVHKFDKMNLENSGIFHPRGTEIIINSEVVCICIFIVIFISQIFIFSGT